jgi:hypothetical protein
MSIRQLILHVRSRPERSGLPVAVVIADATLAEVVGELYRSLGYECSFPRGRLT